MLFLSVDRGALQARISSDKGDLEFAGPDLQGNPLANVLKFGPLEVTTAAGVMKIGGISASTTIVAGLELHQALGGKTITTRLTFPHEGVLRYEVVDWQSTNPLKVSISGESDSHEHFYGFGEKFNALDQAGHQIRMVAFDPPGQKGDRSYKVAPWFVSTRGYGFHFDSTAESTFDMRATHPDRYVITSSFPKLRFNVVYGPKLTDVLTRYTAYTGRPHLPPQWAFGPWISSDIWRSGGEVRYAVEKFRALGIPASGFVFDSPWETAYNDFRFNMEQFGAKGHFEGNDHDGFSSAVEMMSFLQQRGLKVICWMTPFVNDKSTTGEAPGQLTKAGTYDDGKAEGVYVRTSPNGPPLLTGWWKGRGSPVDFTKPAAAAWLTDQLKSLVSGSEVVTQSGVKEPAIGGFKTDDGEALTDQNSPTTPNGEYIPLTAAYADGRTGQEMRNAYNFEYLKAISSVLGTNGLLFARSGSTGTQAFPGCWAGDNEPNFGDANGLPSVIVAGMSAAMSAFSVWGHDVGGYQNTNFSTVSPANLFMRWTQFGCFSPIMQMHRQVFPNPNDLRQYPWGFGDEALQNYKSFARLHTALFPYIYTYVKESSITGIPIMRPLVLLHQDDPRTFSIKHTYRFGNELLVAPVVKPTKAGAITERTVYLPEGNWHDFWTQEKHIGKQDFLWRNSDQQKFPLFVREGGIVPMLLDLPDTLCEANYVNNPTIHTPDAGLQFLVYPTGGLSRFTLYDGTQLTCQVKGAATTLMLSSPPRPVLLKILGAKPAAVTRNGVALAEQPEPVAFHAATIAWHHDARVGFVFIKFQHSGGVAQIAL
jgi:alpha-D-xyloside xylohydrolase